MEENQIIKCYWCGSPFKLYSNWKTPFQNYGTFHNFFFCIDGIDSEKLNCFERFHSHGSIYELCLAKCPNCGKETIEIISEYEYSQDKDKYIELDSPNISSPVKPKTKCEIFPDYIPATIRTDYEEACAIMHLSPKASATLSRRCLQSMIRDFWGIHKSNLNEELIAIKDKITPTMWKAIDSIRQLGNIGAHPERDINLIVDIEDGEAEKMVKLIELLIKQWYINRHEQEQLFSDIAQINSEKQQERKNNPYGN